MTQNIKKFLNPKIYLIFLTKTINTLYFFLLPKNKKIVLNGFFNKPLGYIKKFNFGDDLNFYILKRIFPTRTLFSANNLLFFKENLLFIGSIIGNYSDSKSIIWGSGAIEDNIIIKKPKRILGVRGPMTRDLLLKNNIDCPSIYSDPALLLPILYNPNNKKKYKYGIIPHYVDIKSENLILLKSILGNNVKIISLINYSSIQDVINQINECEYILSSSLHGIIVSDAYKVPNIWIELSNKVVGSGFKFYDYFSSVNRAIKSPLCIKTNISREEIDQCLHQYDRPNIDIIPFLKATPIQLNNSIIEKAYHYYNVSPSIIDNYTCI